MAKQYHPMLSLRFPALEGAEVEVDDVVVVFIPTHDTD
jgi:hypothetical protein